MYISDILEQKGSTVITIVATESIQDAARILREKRFGALVVRNQLGKLAGILSERDIIRGVADKGPTALLFRVEDLMTSQVFVCRATDPVKEVMIMMTKRNIRHVPVVDDKGELCGMISATDIIRFRLNERSSEVNVLKDISRSKV